jgi:hypothetical protein
MLIDINSQYCVNKAAYLVAFADFYKVFIA